jgi:hypothetical protein
MKTLIALFVLISTSSAFAQDVTLRYALENVWLDPDLTHPWESPQLMTGTIEWTYTVGDFDNGSGEFIQLNLPWHNGNGPALDSQVEVDQIEVTMPGNWHDWGADVSLKLLQPLSLSQPAPVDLVFSSFDIEASGISRKGHVISGSVVPESPFSPYCFGDGTSAACPCGNLGSAGQGCANSTGSGAQLAGSGSPSVSADDLQLTVTSLPANQFGILYMGPDTSEIPFGDGNRCVDGGGVGLFRYDVFNGGTGGTWTEGPGIIGFAQGNFPVTGHIAGGQTWHFQAWYRDPTGPCGLGFNLSNGYGVTFTP